MKYIPAIFVAAVVVTAGASAASAGMVTTDYVKVKTLNQYAGDTTVFLEKNPAQCEQGFWMRPNQEGFEEKLDALEKAAHSNTRVKITGNTSVLWPQLEQANCLLESVDVEAAAASASTDLDGLPPDDIRHLDKSEEDGLVPPKGDPLVDDGLHADKVPLPPRD